MLQHLHPVKSTCAVIAGVVGGWTLSGVLSAIASLVAIIVGGLQIYDWVQRKRGKRPPK
jgi:hypothetical protein